MNFKKIIFIIVLSSLFFTAGLFTYKYFFDSSKNLDAAYQQGWDDAKKRFDEYKISEDKIKQEIYSITGQVEKIEAGRIYIDIKPIEPLDSPDLDKRIAIINQETSLSKNTKKDENLYKKEIEEFYLKNPEYKNRPDAVGIPSMFEYVQIKINNISQGMTVRVRTTENIRSTKEFVAKEILVFSENQ